MNNERVLKIILEIVALSVNAIIALAFYVAEQNFSHGGFVKNNLGILTERAFLVGLLAIVILVIARLTIKNLSVYCMLITMTTLWNQTCLITFLVSSMPFRLN